MNDAPTLITGLTRLIAVFFGVRSIENTTAAIYALTVQMTMAPEIRSHMRNFWMIYLPAIALNIAMVATVWWLAPHVASAACKPAPVTNPSSSPVP